MKNESANIITPATIDEVKALLRYSEKGQIYQTMDNAVLALEYDPFLSGAIAHNLLTDRTDVTRDLPWRRTEDQLDETDLVNILYYLEKTYGLSSERRIRNAVTVVSGRHEYHPIREYLDSLSWDGTERMSWTCARGFQQGVTNPVCSSKSGICGSSQRRWYLGKKTL